MKKLLVISVLACTVLWACKKGGDSFKSTTTLLNAAIDMPAVSFNINGKPFISSIAFDSLIKNVSNESGTYTFNISGAGLTKLVYPSVTTGFTSGNSYTAILYDSLNYKTAADSVHIYFQPDAFPTSITDGKCSIRFFDLVPDTLNSPTSTKNHIFLKVDTGSVAVNGVGSKYYFVSRSCGDFGKSNAFAEFDTTSSFLKVVSDTTTGASHLIDSTNYGFKNGKIYTIYFVGAYGAASAPKKPHLIVQQHN